RAEEGSANLARLPSHPAFQSFAVAGVLALPPVRAQVGLQGMTKLGQLDRLQKVMVGAGVETLGDGVGILSRGDDDDGCLWPASLNFLHQPYASQAWHAQIGDHDGGRVALQQLERLLGRTRRLTFE